MLGGIDNSLYLTGLSGFLVVIFLIFVLKWVSPNRKDPAMCAERRELKRSLRELKRK